ncbi:MAG: DUF1294 domain-containing protein [Alistipes sp.]|nr:DUF1294 domain-containing protein [Alistipes sp.]
MTQLVVTFLLVINIVAFFAFGTDKWKAKKGKWRIPESTLMLLALVGGSIGAWCGMRVWHHKTMHTKFRYGLPAIFIAQVIILFYFL